MTAIDIEQQKEEMTENDYLNHIMSWSERAGNFVLLCDDLLRSTRSIIPEGVDTPYERVEPSLSQDERGEVRQMMLSAMRELHRAIISENLTPKL